MVTIALKEPLTADDLLTRDFYSFIVVATNPISGVGETAVLISLPQKTCEGMQITQETIDTTTFLPTSVTFLPTSVETTVNTKTTEFAIEFSTTFSTVIDSESTENTTDFTTVVDSETTEDTNFCTTLVDSETIEKLWNETASETTPGCCT